jgi:hypothetical protein
MFIAKHPRNIPANFYKPTRQLIVRWGFTELYIRSIIWHVLHITDLKVGRSLTWNINTVDKVALFKALTIRWVKDPVKIATIQDIPKEADRLRKERNKYAHGIWGNNPTKKLDWHIF